MDSPAGDFGVFGQGIQEAGEEIAAVEVLGSFSGGSDQILSFFRSGDCKADDRIRFYGAELLEDGIFGPEPVHPGHLSDLHAINIAFFRGVESRPTGEALLKYCQMSSVILSTSFALSMKPNRFENVISPITSKANHCSHTPRSQTWPLLAKSSSSRSKNTRMVEST